MLPSFPDFRFVGNKCQNFSAISKKNKLLEYYFSAHVPAPHKPVHLYEKTLNKHKPILKNQNWLNEFKNNNICITSKSLSSETRHHVIRRFVTPMFLQSTPKVLPLNAAKKRRIIPEVFPVQEFFIRETAFPLIFFIYFQKSYR